MKIFLIITTIWTGFWIISGIAGFIETPQIIKRDREFIENSIKPSVDFIKTFKIDNNRYPTNKEFYTWQREFYNDYSSDLNNPDSSILGGVRYIRSNKQAESDELEDFKNADWSKDFVIAIWRGEWYEYYYSWNDSYKSNNFNWFGGLLNLLISFGIGLIPILFWVLNNRKRKDENNSTSLPLRGSERFKSSEH